MSDRAVALAPIVAGAIALLVLTLALVSAAPAGAKKAKGSCANATTEPSALSYDQATDAIRCLINRKRAAHGMWALAANGDLNDASQKHTDYMVEHGCVDHQCSGEADMVARIKSAGYLNGAMSWTVARTSTTSGVGFVTGTPTSAHEANAAIYTTDFGFSHG